MILFAPKFFGGVNFVLTLCLFLICSSLAQFNRKCSYGSETYETCLTCLRSHFTINFRLSLRPPFPRSFCVPYDEVCQAQASFQTKSLLSSRLESRRIPLVSAHPLLAPPCQSNLAKLGQTPTHQIRAVFPFTVVRAFDSTSWRIDASAILHSREFL